MTSRFPRRHLSHKLLFAFRANRLDHVRTFSVHHRIQFLEIGKVLREEMLDHLRVDELQVAEFSHHSCEENHDHVSLIPDHAGIVLNQNLIRRRG